MDIKGGDKQKNTHITLYIFVQALRRANILKIYIVLTMTGTKITRLQKRGTMYETDLEKLTEKDIPVDSILEEFYR